jgi:hypothetical protein
MSDAPGRIWTDPLKASRSISILSYYRYMTVDIMGCTASQSTVARLSNLSRMLFLRMIEFFRLAACPHGRFTTRVYAYVCIIPPICTQCPEGTCKYVDEGCQYTYQRVYATTRNELGIRHTCHHDVLRPRGFMDVPIPRFRIRCEMKTMLEWWTDRSCDGKYFWSL